MSGQPKLFSESEAGDRVQTSAIPEVSGDRTIPLDAGTQTLDAGAARSASRAAPVWLQRVSLLVLVLFCVYLGVLVLILPWWTRIWDHNLFIQARPWLARTLHNGAVRGFISGLGLIDIWIGISEAVHYRDYRG